MANIMRLGGGGGSGEIPITENGVYDVKKYATANVNVQSAPVLLWTNASPTSNFAKQTVSVDGSGFTMYVIEIKYSTTADYYDAGLVEIGSEGAIGAIDKPANYGVVRVIEGCNANGVTFGWSHRGPTSGDNYAVPTRIWGVKFTL